MTITLDKIRGMFLGAFLGDALGAPHEWRSAKIVYSGKLEHQIHMRTKWQGTKVFRVGTVTDDSEMTLTLLRRIIADRGYNKDNVIMAYLRWANSGTMMMGTNTRALFKGVTTINGYKKRLNKVLALPMSGRSQSNGAMMRCSPLALLWDNNHVITDVSISNPNFVCMDCNIIYVQALRMALTGSDATTILNTVKGMAQTDEVKGVLLQVERREGRNIIDKRGWCLHALWCTFITITSFNNYSEAMRWIITSQPGSDTDTNACIAGALLGAILGYEQMIKEPAVAENLPILLNVQNMIDRPIEYTPHDFYELTEEAYELFNRKM